MHGERYDRVGSSPVHYILVVDRNYGTAIFLRPIRPNFTVRLNLAFFQRLYNTAVLYGH